MADSESRPARKRLVSQTATPRNGHHLVRIAEAIPGPEPTDVASSLTDGPTYRTHYWRCRHCGQERSRRSDFTEPCDIDDIPALLSDGGYSVDEPRTRRALTEEMTVQADGETGSYTVETDSPQQYTVDLREWTCTCPDFEQRTPVGGCKHLRRVDIAVRVGTVPGPRD